MAIQKVDNHFVVSSNGTWLPGAYEDERTARAAYRLQDDVLQKLQDAANLRAAEGRGVGVITRDDTAGAKG